MDMLVYWMMTCVRSARSFVCMLSENEGFGLILLALSLAIIGVYWYVFIVFCVGCFSCYK